MRITILSLFLLAGPIAFCQSTVPASMTPDNLGPAPLLATPPSRDFSKLPPGWHMPNVRPLPTPRTVVVPKAAGTRLLGDARIDPKMIVHPPSSSIGVQPPGTQIAQNEFSHLQMLPIESTRSASRQRQNSRHP
jgi:hypothetical protein